MELTIEQEKAIKSLERAIEKCYQSNIYFHNCYGILVAYDGNVVKVVNDDESETSCEYSGHPVSSKYHWDSWADDDHYVHLKEKRSDE